LFPTSSMPIKPLHAPEPEAAKWRGTGTALIIDDEDGVVSLARHMLERMGFAVLSAADGQTGLGVFQEHESTIRFILLDMMMPHMGGEETFIELRRRQPNVKVILSSGYNEQTATSRFAGQGLAGFIQKPYTFEQLQAIVKKILHGEAT
jgi:two-component system, cell cycle sensor histidine kinase and response regulator CckA